MKKILFFGLLFTCQISLAQTEQAAITSLIKKVMPLAEQQYLLLDKNTPDSLMPRNYEPGNNKLNFSDTKWWCSGFFPGTLWYIYEYTKNEKIRQIAEKRLDELEPQKYFTGNHDLGFMIYCPFGNAYRITGNKKYIEVINTAAGSLATRYRPTIKSIQSWESNKRLSCPVIIDNMMNLELLYWSGTHGGNPYFLEIANNHAMSTIKNHFREDYSSFHVIDYDLTTNQLIKKITWQGANDTSAWSRGQSWGLYGFTMMYRFTKNQAYLNQAKKIANFLMNTANQSDDAIPYWDYDAPTIPNAYRDASAGAVMASALLELAQYATKAEKKSYIVRAEKIILSLGSEKYLSSPGENAGFLIKHNVGSIPHNSEVDASLTYADYYFLESLLRYKKWYL
jgi:rhamnogalacturonyl hydrolase YesR